MPKRDFIPNKLRLWIEARKKAESSARKVMSEKT